MERIKQLIERKGLTCQEFARTYGIPLRTFQKWMRGERHPPQYVVDLLEEVVLHDIWLGEHGRVQDQG